MADKPRIVITGPNTGKLFDKYEVKSSGYVLSGHSSKLGARRARKGLLKRYPTRGRLLGALEARNYRPFNR